MTPDIAATPEGAQKPVRRALLLAGGIGSRLRPLTLTVPKCLVPIHGRPLLDYWIEMLLAGGFERVLVNTHWLAPAVEAFVEQSRWRAQIDLVHEPELLGTGGTILANRAYFSGEPFLVAHADNLISFTVSKFIAAHRGRVPGAVLTMLAFHTDDPRSCGILECDDRGVVLAFHEKVADPPGTLANGAVYVVEDEVVRYIAGIGRPFVDLSTEVMPAFLGRIQSWTTDGYHRDIGNIQSLARAEAEFPSTTK
jgi:mannose-1-phosphate guanylyltransferase